MNIYNLINSIKTKNLYSIINPTLILNPYITDFPKEWFEKRERRWSFLQFLKSSTIFYFKLSIKLSIFTLQKILFSLFWNRKDRVEKVIIDIFLLSDRVLKSGKFIDTYFQNLPEILEKRDIPYSYLPRIYGLGINPLRFLQLLNILKKENKSFIFEYQLVSYLDILKILFQIAIYPFQTLQLLQNREKWENRLFNFHLIQDIARQDLIAWTRYFAGRKLVELQNIEKIISWSEFQVVERGFNFGYRSAGGRGKIYGSQLYISYPAYLNTFVFSEDQRSLSAPHQVLVNGKYFLENRDSEFYRLGVSLRYGEVFRFQKDTQKREKILLLASYLKDETNQMIDICKNIDLQLKLHPTQKPNDFQIPNSFQLTDRNIYELFQTSKIVITTGSGTAVEAVAVGVSVIIIESQTNLTSNPLVDYGKGEIWDSVNSTKEILEKMDKLEKFRRDNPERIEEISQWYKDNFFVEPTEENIIKAFEL